MKKTSRKKILSVLALAVAFVCVVIGARNVWLSFRDFDETTLKEKDTQFEKLIMSDDSGLDTAIASFIRESGMLFGRERVKTIQKNWIETGDASELRDFIENASLKQNPLFDGFMVIRKSRIVNAVSQKYSFVTEADDKGLRICINETGKYGMAYEYKSTDGVTYYAVMDIEDLYAKVLEASGSGTDSTIIMDSTGSIVAYRLGGTFIASPVSEVGNDNIRTCVNQMLEFQNSGVADGISVTLKNGNGDNYTARLVVKPSRLTENGSFAIGIMANYDKAVAPSKAAAHRILIYGGVAFAGFAIILMMMVYMRRTTSLEMENLRRRNEAMEEINRKMQVLAHHQRLETIGTMTAGIAHDFNNLLTPIMGYSMMTMEMLTDEQTDLQDNLMEVYNASVKAKDMVSRLADLSKTGDESRFEEHDPDLLVKNALKVTLPAKPKTVDVKVSFNCEGSVIRGDETQLSQMIMNLVLNAYDAMEENGGTLMISSSVENDEIIWRFRDNGPGMDAETVARIFDPFFTTKESGKGTGLGLAIVAQIAETHGARVYVDSDAGSGTEFKVVFPSKKQ